MPLDRGVRQLRDCESLALPSDELQWRQIHPNDFDGDEVGASGFVGTSKDRDAVSCCRSSTRTAAEAYDHHVVSLELKSGGTYGVTIAEVHESACELIDDASCDDVTTPGHSFISMHGLETKAERKAARTNLAFFANARGRRHPANP